MMGREFGTYSEEVPYLKSGQFDVVLLHIKHLCYQKQFQP
jgi:hypothetical protein